MQRRCPSIKFIVKPTQAFRFFALPRWRYCQWCGKKLSKSTATTDHVVPVSKGGGDEFGNLVLSCLECNHDRGDKGGGTPLGPNWQEVWESAFGKENHQPSSCLYLLSIRIGDGPWRPVRRGTKSDCDRERFKIEDSVEGAECRVEIDQLSLRKEVSHATLESRS